MWLYPLGLTKVKKYALTGKPFSWREAADIGLINRAVPFAQLEETVRETAGQLASLPASQSEAMKLGLNATPTLGPILDGLMRNTPDAIDFIQLAERKACARSSPDAAGPSAVIVRPPENERPNPNRVVKI
jgi:enoyl-CoA hydratase